jgi:hypothetical protein
MGVQSYDGEGEHRHLGIIMTELEYIIQVLGEELLSPENLGPNAAIPDGADTVKANIMIQEHGEIIWSYHLGINVDNACVKLLLDAFDDKFMSARADPIVRYANETAISLITHLKE